MHRCTPACFNADQGRHCLCSTNASRAALGMPPLRTKDDKTGWPAPALAQDDHRGLFHWFASKPDARALARESASSIEGLRTSDGGMTVSGHFAFPIEREEEDEPVAPESAESAWAVVQSILAYIAVAMLTLAAVSILSTGAP